MKNRKAKDATNTIKNTVVPVTIHKEYIAYHDATSDKACSKTEVVELVKELLRKKTSLERKRLILFRLAHTPLLRALYGIQKYLKDPDKELASWAVICWQEAQAGVLKEGMRELFGDEAPETDVIMGGLGGDGEKLRYVFVLSTIQGHTLEKRHKDIVKEVTDREDKRPGIEIEHVHFNINYIIVTSLVSFNIAVGAHIERIINECNAVEPFLRFHYFVKNTELFTEDEINTYLAELSAENM